MLLCIVDSVEVAVEVAVCSTLLCGSVQISIIAKNLNT